MFTPIVEQPEVSAATGQLFRAGFEAFGRGDLDGFLETWAEDSVLIIPESAPGGGTYRGKPAIKDYLKWLYWVQIKNFRLRIQHVVCRGSVVAVEWVYYGRAGADKTFDNQSVFVFKTNAEGQVAEAREYTDTQQLRQMLTGE